LCSFGAHLFSKKKIQGRTDGHGYIDSARRPDQEYIHILYGGCEASFNGLQGYKKS